MARRLAFLCVGAILFAFRSVPVSAQQFSADMVRTNPPGKIDTKVYVSGDRVRFEATAQTRTSVALVDLSTETSLMMIPDNKTYVKSPPGHIKASIPFFHVTDPENACAAWEKSQGTPGTCTKVGEETIAGRSALKYKGTVANGDTGYVWVDRKLKFAIKWEGEKSAAELQNIQEGPQAATLFQVPAGYEMFDLAAAQQEAKTKGKTKGPLVKQQRRPATAQ